MHKIYYLLAVNMWLGRENWIRNSFTNIKVSELLFLTMMFASISTYLYKRSHMLFSEQIFWSKQHHTITLPCCEEHGRVVVIGYAMRFFMKNKNQTDPSGTIPIFMILKINSRIWPAFGFSACKSYDGFSHPLSWMLKHCSSGNCCRSCFLMKESMENVTAGNQS